QQRRRVPENFQKTRALASLQGDGDRLGRDQVPGRDRHHEHDAEDDLAHEVGLGEEAGEAGSLLRVHGGQPSSRKEIGISTHAATGSVPRLAETKRQRLTVSRAASSSRGKPLEVRTCTSSAEPLVFTSTRRSTRPCSPWRREMEGYLGAGLSR